MGESFVWWLALELLGFIALPVAAVVFRALPDRGYSASKVLGLLLTGWLAYTLAMMQLAAFTRGLLYFAVVGLAGFSAWLLWRKNRALLTKLRAFYGEKQNLRYVVAAELLFTLTFIFWALMRAYSPDIFSTEKFMDFGFMNSIVKSESFPPNDMWMAGHPINYYYFGYVLMASLGLISGVPTEIGYNLANSTIPALLALGTFGLIYNLIRSSRPPDRAGDDILRRNSGLNVPPRRTRPTHPRPRQAQEALPVRRATRTGTGATKTVVGAAVVEGPIAQTATVTVALANGHTEEEVPTVEPKVPDELYEVFEHKEDDSRLPGLTAPIAFGVLAALMVVAMGHLTTMFAVVNPAEQGSWRACFSCQTPQNFDWWSPSRVIRDARTVEVDGQPSKQVSGISQINEFPAFSFLLADLHPHVMALPLWPLAMSLALAFARRRVKREGTWRDGLPTTGRAGLTLALAAIAIGALYTTNTWDYPTFLLIALAGLVLPHFAFRRANPQSSRWGWLRPIIVEAAILVLSTFVSFAFFHMTFTSLVGGQAAQIPENLASIPVVGWLLEKAGSLLLVNTWDKGITGFLLIFGIFLFGIVGWLIFEVGSVRSTQDDRQSRNRVLIISAAVALLSLLLAILFRFPMLALCVPLSTFALLLIWRDPEQVTRNLVLFILALASLIAISIEVVYLRDVFNDRQNTIFKFYYQIWVLYAVVAAYGVWRVLAAFWQRRSVASGSYAEPMNSTGRALSAGWAALFTLLVASGLTYSIYGPWKKAIDNGSRLWGLDGTAHLARSAPGDYDALRWLKANASGRDRVLECCHDEYNVPGHAGRVSAYTGVPTLISWGGHEAQWRGGQPELLAEASVRRQVTNELYTARGGTMSPQEMLALLQQYEVDYVFVGATERGEGSAAGAYPEERVTPQAEEMFKQVLSPVFTSGTTVIYEVPEAVPGGGNRRTP